MYRLTSGSPTMTVADVSDRHWIAIIGCGVREHAARYTAEGLMEKFPPNATLGQLAERLICPKCGSKTGNIGFIQGAGAGVMTRTGPDGRTSTGLARNDTLAFNKLWEKVEGPRKEYPPTPTGFGRPRRRR